MVDYNMVLKYDAIMMHFGEFQNTNIIQVIHVLLPHPHNSPHENQEHPDSTDRQHCLPQRVVKG